MKDYLHKLKELIPPNDIKSFPGNEQIAKEVESQFHLALPSDYKELIHCFGSGIYGKVVYVSSYYGRISIFEQQESRREFLNAMLKGFPVQEETLKYPIFPDKGGLLIAGGDENANNLMWLTEGPPDKWPLIYFDDYMCNESIYNMPITEFLYRWLIGELRPLCLEGALHEGEPEIPCERIPIFCPSNVPQEPADISN